MTDKDKEERDINLKSLDTFADMLNKLHWELHMIGAECPLSWGDADYEVVAHFKRKIMHDAYGEGKFLFLFSQFYARFVSEFDISRKMPEKEITDAEKHMCRSYLEMKRLVKSGAVVVGPVATDKTDEEIWQEEMQEGEPLMLLHHLRGNFVRLEAEQKYSKREYIDPLVNRIKKLEETPDNPVLDAIDTDKMDEEIWHLIIQELVKRVEALEKDKGLRFKYGSLLTPPGERRLADRIQELEDHTVIKDGIIHGLEDRLATVEERLEVFEDKLEKVAIGIIKNW